MTRSVAGLALLAALAVSASAGAQTSSATATATKTAAAPVSPDEARRRAENAEVIRLAEQDTGALEVPSSGQRIDDDRSLFGAVIQMVVVLGGVCLLVYLVLGKLLPRLMRVPNPSGRTRLMRVVDRLPIDQRRSMMLVAIGEEYFLVGASETGITLISRLDADTVRSAEASLGPERSGLGRFAEALGGRGSKEP